MDWSKSGILLCLGMAALLGCSRTHDEPGSEAGDGGTVRDQDDPSGSGDKDPDDRPGSGTARDGKDPADSSACLVSETNAEIAVTNIDKVDLLFVVDNSGSMAQEQASLMAQFPKLIKVLTTGDRNEDGDNMDDTDFAPAKDLHLGVVSSDMGLVGISDIMHCAGLGDDGVMQNTPRLANCAATYPRFLSYRAGVNDPDQTANDFSCIATLGTEGCGFEQQLESGLKALWPQVDPMPKSDGTNRITFLGDTNGFGQFGHGDNDNMGFLRNDPVMGLSLIAVIVVSDEQDCSSLNTLHYRPANYLDPAKPEEAQLLMQGLNVRCNFNPQNLYPVDRYIKGFKALRPGAEDLVVFGAIVGVPPETVDAQALSQIESPENVAARDAFYDHILSHRLMQPVVDDHGTPDVNDDTMQASCFTPTGTAFPPTRIVQVAQGFGANGIVQSICQEDFGPAIDNIIGVISRKLGAVCLPRSLVRNDSGKVGCDVIWELPAPGKSPSGTPTSCGAPDYEFLLEPEAGQSTVNNRGGARCRVAQLEVAGGAMLEARPTELEGHTFSDGWYYDDFSNDTQKECSTDPKQRIAFTTRAKPPTGVTVKLECVSQFPIADGAPNESDSAVCSAGTHASDASKVGEPCLSPVPQSGFDPFESYLATDSSQCGGGVCLVHHLAGDPSEGCVPTDTISCPSQSEIEQRMYCSCRCDAPDGYAQCACPDGFACTEILSGGGNALSGGYCVR